MEPNSFSQAAVTPRSLTHGEIEERLPPHNLEAEAAALGSMLISRDAADRLIHFLQEPDFYSPVHAEIFRAMRSVVNQHHPLDVLTVKSELIARERLDAVGGTGYLMQLAESVPSAANAENYAQLVVDYAILRGLHMAGHEIVKIVHSPDKDVQKKIDDAERSVYEVSKRRLGQEFEPIERLAEQFFLEVDRVLETGQPLHGMSTGFADLDRVLTGFYPGNLIILAARPAVGKTSLAIAFALAAARKADSSVAVFSMEMSNIEIVRRLICTDARVDSNVLKRSHIAEDDYQRLADATSRLFNLKMFIDDSSDISPFEMKAKCRRLQAQQGGLSLVIVDYLQLMRAQNDRENRTQQISQIARSLKNLAKELEVPVVALSQLSRSVEHRENKRPMLSDLRESGSIEADADVVMLLYRDDHYQREELEEGPKPPPDPHRAVPIEVHIAKNRNGPTDTVKLAFQPAFTKFSDPARGHE